MFRHSVCVRVLFIGLAAALTACASQYDADVEPGPHGEVGSDLKRVYSKEFRVSKQNYFSALEQFYAFAEANKFDFVRTGDCFGDVLEMMPRTLVKACVAMWAVTGAPTKAHMTFTVEEKSFKRSNKNAHLRYRVEVYIFEGYYPHFAGLGSAFETQVEPKLSELNAIVERNVAQ